MLKKTKIPIAGVGTVGSGVIKLFKKNSIQKNFGIEITAIASRRKIKKSDLGSNGINYFNDAKKLIDFTNYDILVELIGGYEGISKTIVFDALKKGKMLLLQIKLLFQNIGENLMR